jgi:hypothetical protein
MVKNTYNTLTLAKIKEKCGKAATLDFLVCPLYRRPRVGWGSGGARDGATGIGGGRVQPGHLPGFIGMPPRGAGGLKPGRPPKGRATAAAPASNVVTTY